MHELHASGDGSSQRIDFAKNLAISKSGVPGSPDSKYACESLFVLIELTNVL